MNSNINSENQIKNKQINPTSDIFLPWYKTLFAIITMWVLFYPQPYWIPFSLFLVLLAFNIFMWKIGESSKENIKKKYIPMCLFLIIFIFVNQTINMYFVNTIVGLLVKGVSLASIMFLMVIIFTWANDKIRKIFEPILIILVAFILLFSINCVLDTSNPEIYKSYISDKYYVHTGGRHPRTHYYFLMSPWKYNNEFTRYDAKPGWDKGEKGSSVKVYHKKGLFNISWYYFEFDKEYFMDEK